MVQLIINGEMADFEAYISRIVESAVRKVSVTDKAPEMPIPGMLYRTSDPKVHNWLAISPTAKRPDLTVRTRAEAAGVEIQIVRKRGNMISGDAIIKLMTYKPKKSYQSKN